MQYTYIEKRAVYVLQLPRAAMMTTGSQTGAQPPVIISLSISVRIEHGLPVGTNKVFITPMNYCPIQTRPQCVHGVSCSSLLGVLGTFPGTAQLREAGTARNNIRAVGRLDKVPSQLRQLRHIIQSLALGM